MRIFKYILLSTVITGATSYPFIYDTNISLIENYGYAKVNATSDRISQVKHHNEVNHLNTAISLIQLQRASLAQQHDTILVLNEKLQVRTQHLKELQNSVRAISQKIEDFGFAFEGQQGKVSLAERLRNVKLQAHTNLVLNSLVPLGNVLRDSKITSHYGYRIHPITKKKKHHNGTDFSAPIGTAIYAPADGIITSIKTTAESRGSGNFLKVEHGMGFETSYSHLSKIIVKEHGTVSKGDIIAYTGNTGRSTGPHLHYEVSFLGKKINPYPLIKYASHGDIRQLQRESDLPWLSIYDNMSQMSVKTALVLK